MLCAKTSIQFKSKSNSRGNSPQVLCFERIKPFDSFFDQKFKNKSPLLKNNEDLTIGFFKISEAGI